MAQPNKIDPTKRLPGLVQDIKSAAGRLNRGENFEPRFVAQLLFDCGVCIQELGEYINYLDDSLTASVSGELPERFDLNQLLLAKRAKAYMAWLNNNTDPRDKLRPAGSNDSMLSK